MAYYLGLLTFFYLGTSCLFHQWNRPLDQIKKIYTRETYPEVNQEIKVSLAKQLYMLGWIVEYNRIPNSKMYNDKEKFSVCG